MKKFLGLDAHVSVVRDVSYFLNVDLVCMSAHCDRVGIPFRKLDFIDPFNIYFDQDIADRFYKRYKDEFDHYDGFVVGHPSLMSILFEKWGKPIVTVFATRWEFPFHKNPELKKWAAEKMRTMKRTGQLLPIANNRLDQHHVKSTLGFDCTYIPSLCDWVPRKKLDKSNLKIWMITKSVRPIQNATSIPARFTYEELSQCRAIVHVPYQISTMSLFEQYTACIPIVAPDPRWQTRNMSYLSELWWTPEDASTKNPLAYSDYYNLDFFPYIYKVNFDAVTRLSYDQIDDQKYLMNAEAPSRKQTIVDMWERFKLKIP